MPIHSMTGYASAQTQLAPDQTHPSQTPWRLGLEIRSVNSRFLDLSFKMPDELRVHESALRELVSAQLRRGKVELRLHIETQTSTALQAPSAEWLQQLEALQQHVRRALPEATPLSVSEVLRLNTSNAAPTQDLGPALQALTRQALQELQAARAREGERLVQMLRERIALLRDLAERAAPLIPQLVEQQRLRFLERWRDAMALTEGSVSAEAAQERALTEATAFAIRIDVAEEISRLTAHLAEIDRLLAEGGKNEGSKNEGVGKRLDFLIQELHREANTLGSKSATLELSRISVDMKVLIEQLREQVQNLE
jgi:uncharacterized protein (TIGR00255 family)